MMVYKSAVFVASKEGELYAGNWTGLNGTRLLLIASLFYDITWPWYHENALKSAFCVLVFILFDLFDDGPTMMNNVRLSQ